MKDSSTPEHHAEDQEPQRHVNLSVGSGIAITGVWLIAAALTVFLCIFMFTDILVNSTEALEKIKDNRDDSSLFEPVALVIAIFLTALPGIGAYNITMTVLGKDN